MNQKIIEQELKKLESNKNVNILYHFLENKQQNGDNLSEMLLDVVHDAFVSGFEVAVDSAISSFDEKSIE